MVDELFHCSLLARIIVARIAYAGGIGDQAVLRNDRRAFLIAFAPMRVRDARSDRRSLRSSVCRRCADEAFERVFSSQIKETRKEKERNWPMPLDCSARFVQ